MTNISEIDENEKCQIDCLLDQMSVESPMQPIKGFMLNFSTILGIFGLITTYTIILLQFKMDEKK